MTPRAIDVHIEEVVLHGFDPGSRSRIADALSLELGTLLSERGVPSAWFSNPERLNAGPIPAISLNNPERSGREVARAAFQA
jgi:hypothetical protein